jgi:EPS-associated MarR family transcriptional regulator
MASNQDDTRFRVLHLLQQNPDISQRELAKAMGISLGRVNFVLNALVDKGLIKVSNFRKSDKKIRYTYMLTPSGVAEKIGLTANFLKRKISEYEALKAEIESLRREAKGGS